MPNEDIRVLGRFMTECTNRSDDGAVSIWYGPMRATRGRRSASSDLRSVWHVTTKQTGRSFTATENTLILALAESLQFLTGRREVERAIFEKRDPEPEPLMAELA